jgi:hypothetical protein
MVKESSFWSRYPSWESANEAWESRAKEAQQIHPLKNLKVLPKMPAMTLSTKRLFKLKALIYLIYHDRDFKLIRSLVRQPFKRMKRYLQSCWRGKSYKRDDDFFFYGVESTKHFLRSFFYSPTVFLLGFSYCHKPYECPDGRFSDRCRADEQNVICQQCFIAKAVHAAPIQSQLLFIPTVHYIAQKVFEALENAEGKQVLFLISACEMTLEMFGDWGNAVGIEGIGVRLDGRICNTMRAFELSERGIKPGLTVVLPKTQERILQTLKQMSNFHKN